MKLEEINIKIEKLGNVEIFSYNGFILACTNKGYSDIIYFFPLLVNKDILEKKENLLTTYLDFIDVINGYLRYTYSPKYDLEIKENNKNYQYCNRFQLVEIISNISSNVNMIIKPEFSINFKDFAYMVLKETSLLDKKITLNSVDDVSEKLTINTLSIDINNYITVSIDRLDNWGISFICLDYEKEIKDIVNILKHIFEMHDKSLGR